LSKNPQWSLYFSNHPEEQKLVQKDRISKNQGYISAAFCHRAEKCFQQLGVQKIEGSENNRPFSYSLYWTGTSMQLRLMQGVFSNASKMSLA